MDENEIKILQEAWQSHYHADFKEYLKSLPMLRLVQLRHEVKKTQPEDKEYLAAIDKVIKLRVEEAKNAGR